MTTPSGGQGEQPWQQPNYENGPAYPPPGAGYPAAPQYPPNYPPGYPGYGPYGYPPPGYTPWGFRAPMGSRFGQLIIDWLVVGLPTLFLGYVVGLHPFRGILTTSNNVCSAGADECSGFSIHFNWGFLLVSSLVGYLYWGILVGLQGQTLGHRAVGIKVVDYRTGGYIGFWRAVLRRLVLDVTGAICTLGYWSPFFDPLRRGWHDKAADAIVVVAR
ncbi:MAG: RDD family protein [Actinobacteria bacterium]|nr:RDD family protein [Actinomycetota bacterium]